MRAGCRHRTLGDDIRFAQHVGSRLIFFWNLNCLRDKSLKDQPLSPRVNWMLSRQSLKDDGGKKYGFLREAEECAILQDCL